MRHGSIRLGRMFGVPVSMDLGVVVVLGVLTWSLANVVLPPAAPGFVPLAYWSLAALGSLAFLFSLLAHEFGHALMARRHDVGVEGITMWILGGYAQFESEPRTASADFRISAAGPAVSLFLGAGFMGAATGLRAIDGPSVHVALLGWLALINVVLGVFNLLPGSPLDGGRMLAAVLWKVTGSRLSGRIGAARFGEVIGVVLVVVGGLGLLGSMDLTGLWAVVVGCFLFSTARNELTHYLGERALEGMTLGEVMAPSPHFVRTWTSVAELVEGPLRNTHRSAVAVTGVTGAPVAVVTMADIHRVPAASWSSTTVAEIADEDSLVGTAGPDEDLLGFIERQHEQPGGYAVVVHDGHPVGVIGPDEVRTAIGRGRARTRRSARRMPPPPPFSAPRQRWDPPVPTR